MYPWGLGAIRFGNAFYAAAVQAGTTSWKAFFFGSLDSANLITVDKPLASLWGAELSGRLFGFSSWSMLVPQALMAVAAVALLWATVRRVAGPVAGLLAGALFALTPGGAPPTPLSTIMARLWPAAGRPADGDRRFWDITAIYGAHVTQPAINARQQAHGRR